MPLICTLINIVIQVTDPLIDWCAFEGNNWQSCHSSWWGLVSGCWNFFGKSIFCQHLEFWHQALGGGGFVTVFHIEVVTTGKDGDRELVKVRFGDSASRSLRLSDFRVFRLGWKDQITSCPIVVACWRSESWPVWCLCWQNDWDVSRRSSRPRRWSGWCSCWGPSSGTRCLSQSLESGQWTRHVKLKADKGWIGYQRTFTPLDC